MNTHLSTSPFAMGSLSQATPAPGEHQSPPGGLLLLAAAILAMTLFAGVIRSHSLLQDSFNAAPAVSDLATPHASNICVDCATVQQIRVLHTPRSGDDGALNLSSLFAPAISAYTGNAGGYLAHFDRRYRLTLRMNDGSTRVAETGLSPQFSVGDEVRFGAGGRVLAAGQEM